MPIHDEFELIRQWTNPYQSAALQKILGVAVGIGDDAAIVESTAGFQLVLSCDTMVEGIHFNHKTMQMADVGFKAMSAALSDLAAMGAIARYALVALTLPKNMNKADSQQLYEGLYECAGKFGVAIIGGDTTSSSSCMVITIQVIGEVESGKALLRSSAQKGDIVAITGHLGRAAAGLDYLNRDESISFNLDSIQQAAIDDLIDSHRRPIPQLRAGRLLLQSGSCHALNDLSDGLASEAWEIVEASNTGINLYEKLLPVHPSLTVYGELAGRDALDWILYGGEDYQLLVTIPSEAASLVEAEFSRKQLYFQRIGEISDSFTGVRLLLKNGEIQDILKKGFNHFT